MSAPVALRPTEMTGRALENRQLDAGALENRYLRDRSPANKYFVPAGTPRRCSTWRTASRPPRSGPAPAEWPDPGTDDHSDATR